ncbi:MAG: EamA family transporter [Candidatus Nomurabacteria bacterium]|nr:EamA family transporter [Candidatus Nomurabacteria bacterium]
MSWLLIAIWAPLLWAFSNHIDKYLITRFGEGVGIKGLITFSSLFSIFIVIGTYLLDPNIFSIIPLHILLLIISGILYTVAILLYLFALSKDETSIVTPTFQLIPVLAFILGFIFLGELMTNKQMLGGLIVILGAVIISIDFSSFKFKKNIFLLMITSSLSYAIYQVLFKVGASENFYNSVFWQSVGIFISAIVLFSIKSYRQEFFTIFKKDALAICGFSALVELTTVAGNLLISKALMMAPVVAMVLMVEAFQPIFVFILGIIFTVFIPSFGKEDISKKVILQKVFAMSIIIFGSYFLYF